MSSHRADRATGLTRQARGRMLLFCVVALLAQAILVPLADDLLVRYLLACTLILTAIVLGMLLGTEPDSEDLIR